MLISVTSLDPHDLLLGLWKIEPDNRLNARQNERVAVACLLTEMLGDEAEGLDHLSSGKPVLAGWHVSVSHTKGYAAVLLSRTREVGVDIEYRSDRVGRVASRFLRDDEHPGDMAAMLAYWSAKEAVYKLFSDDLLAFQEMRLSPTAVAGRLRCENLKRGVGVDVVVEANDAFTLTYVWL